MKKVFGVLGYPLFIAVNLLPVFILIIFLVTNRNGHDQIQVSEDEYCIVCMVSQSVGKDITHDVMSVVSNTGENIQSVVFRLYPEEYASARGLMNSVDESMNLS